MEEKTIVQKEEGVEITARRANNSDLWNKLWKEEGDDTWRKEALTRVYSRICALVNTLPPWSPNGNVIVDIGGGRGILAKQIVDECSLVGQNPSENMMVIDHSDLALEAVVEKGMTGIRYDLETIRDIDDFPSATVYVSTECLEHLSTIARNRVLETIKRNSNLGAMISVPNNRLGPEEEPQHTIKFTTMSFKKTLESHFEHVRVEVMGPFLLGVCGQLAKKDFTLSATLPVRDEENDLEPTLASLRGIADQLVVGIDPRTKDKTWEIAELYADKVFYLRDPMGPPDNHTLNDCLVCDNDCCREYMGEDGVNFSWIRNQCIAECDGEWIFMTEGHERLVGGQDILLQLDRIVPKQARIGLVLRQGNGQQWSFPWLFKNAKDIFFSRPVHNTLDYPDGTYVVKLPQIKMFHDRHEERGKSRAKQRKAQNRNALLDDWLARKSEASLFYLGQEWRDIDPNKAIERLEQFLTVSNNGVQRYQARLILSKEYMRKGNAKDAFRVLHGCTSDDWTRSEHFIWLGDIAFLQEDYEKAHRFYTYAATCIGDPPFTVWWIDLIYYGHLPAQRLAQVCAQMGRIEESLMWARKVIELLPDDSPTEAFTEAEENVTILEEALSQCNGDKSHDTKTTNQGHSEQ